MPDDQQLGLQAIPAPDPPKNVAPRSQRDPRYNINGVNNPLMYPYDPEDRAILQADFVEILSHGYSVTRAMRLLRHWATSSESHKDIFGGDREGPHPSFGRAIPTANTFYFWKEKPEFAEFKAAWERAVNVEGTEALEDHALDMAYNGNDKLVMFLLKARNPAKYANFGQLSGGGFQINITAQDEQL